MQRFRGRIAALALTGGKFGILLIATLACLQAKAGQHIIITNGEWTPYQSEKLPHYGFASLIVTEAFAVSGVSVEYRFRPWKRAFEEAKVGSAHASLIWSKTKEREPFFLFSDPILTSEAVLFHRKKMTFDWKTFADLEPYVIGRTLGYQYKIEEWPKLKFDQANTDEQNLQKLALGRIDLFPCDKYACYELLNNKLPPQVKNQLTHHPVPYDQTPYTVIFSRERRDTPPLLALFNEGLQKLKSSGRYKEILEAQQSATLSMLTPTPVQPTGSGSEKPADNGEKQGSIE